MRHKLRTSDWLPIFGKAHVSDVHLVGGWPWLFAARSTAWPSPCPASCATSFDNRQPTFHLRFHPDHSCDSGDAIAAIMISDWKPRSHKR